jgi:two-component system, sensor histidine kinase and response regulator
MNDGFYITKQKKTKYCFFTALLGALLFPSLLFAQTNKLDSLLNIVSTMPDDTSKMNTLHEIGYEYYKIDKSKKTLEYATKELMLAQKLNNKRGIGAAYLNHGIFYLENRKYDLALYYDKKALAIMKELNNKLGMSTCYINLSLLHMRKGEYNEAISYFSKAIQLKQEIRDMKGMALAYNNISIVLVNQGKYQEALRYSQTALKISDSLKDEENIGRSINNIGVNFLAQRKYDEALEYFFKSIKGIKTTTLYPLAIAYNNIGSVYHEKEQYELALTYYLKSLNIRKQTNARNGLSLTYTNIGNIYLAKKQYKTALYYGLEGYKLALENEDKGGIQMANQSLGSCYEEMKRYDEAEKYYKLALTGAKDLNYQDGIAQGLANFSSLYRKKGEFEKALDYMELFKKQNDSLLSRENREQFNELNTRYETERKEREIDQLTKDRELNEQIIQQQKQVRWALIVGLFLLSVLMVNIYLRYHFKQKANKILEERKKEIEKNVIELTDAKDELNHVLEQKEKLTSILAHDLRTPLRFMSTISEHMYRNGKTLTDKEQEELSLELSNTAKSTFSFADELLTWLSVQKDNYKLSYTTVEIGQLLNGLCTFFSDIAKIKAVALKLEWGEELMAETDSRLLKIILRNIIDNALKNTNEGVITMRYFKINDSQFEIQVQDTGSGMSAEHIEKLMEKNLFGFSFEIRDKLGFQIVKDFSRLIGGSVKLESELNKGTTVILTVPLKA